MPVWLVSIVPLTPWPGSTMPPLLTALMPVHPAPACNWLSRAEDDHNIRWTEWRNNNKKNLKKKEINKKGLGLWSLLVALLIPGLPVDSIAGYLPSVGDVLSDLLRVAVPLTPLAVMLCCEAHGVLLSYRRGIVSHEVGPQTPAERGTTYLGHLHLLHGADHVRCFFAPVTLDDVSLYGRAIDGHNGMSRCLVGVEPEK